MKKFTVIYFFNHSTMGFSNEFTVDAISQEQAIEKVKLEVAMCYGSAMLKKFTFKNK